MTFIRTSIIIWADSYSRGQFLSPNSGGKGEDEPPPASKLANERDPFVGNTITLV